MRQGSGGEILSPGNVRGNEKEGVMLYGNIVVAVVRS